MTEGIDKRSLLAGLLAGIAMGLALSALAVQQVVSLVEEQRGTLNWLRATMGSDVYNQILVALRDASQAGEDATIPYSLADAGSTVLSTAQAWLRMVDLAPAITKARSYQTMALAASGFLLGASIGLVLSSLRKARGP